MNTNTSTEEEVTPTQEEVAKRAYEIWETRGGPGGRDSEFWFEAERELASARRGNGRDGGSDHHESGNATPTPAHSPTHPHSAAPSPGELAAKALQQKHDARAPQVPTRNAPKTAPVESGKPLWDKPHSK